MTGPHGPVEDPRAPSGVQVSKAAAGLLLKLVEQEIRCINDHGSFWWQPGRDRLEALRAELVDQLRRLDDPDLVPVVWAVLPPIDGLLRIDPYGPLFRVAEVRRFSEPECPPDGFRVDLHPPSWDQLEAAREELVDQLHPADDPPGSPPDGWPVVPQVNGLLRIQPGGPLFRVARVRPSLDPDRLDGIRVDLDRCLGTVPPGAERPRPPGGTEHDEGAQDPDGTLRIVGVGLQAVRRVRVVNADGPAVLSVQLDQRELLTIEHFGRHLAEVPGPDSGPHLAPPPIPDPGADWPGPLPPRSTPDPEDPESCL